MKRSRRNLPIGYRPEEPPANQGDGSLLASLLKRLQRLLLDGHSVCYRTAASFVVCGGASQIVLFLQRSKIFFCPPRCRTVFPFGCRGFTTNGGCLHEVSSHQAFSCSRWSQDERQLGGCILERIEGHRPRAPRYLVGAGWHDRF